MGRKRHTAEEIIGKLRTAEIELAKGLGTAEVVRKLGITEQTYYRWRKEHALSVGATTVQQEKNRSVVSPMSDYPRFPIRELNRRVASGMSTIHPRRPEYGARPLRLPTHPQPDSLCRTEAGILALTRHRRGSTTPTWYTCARKLARLYRAATATEGPTGEPSLPYAR